MSRGAVRYKADAKTILKNDQINELRDLTWALIAERKLDPRLTRLVEMSKEHSQCVVVDIADYS